MIRQVIVVEGKSDIARVSHAVEADMIATEGFGIRRETLEQIRLAYEKRGIIILTDPDGPGERIRKRLTRLFPNALHAFVPKSEASTENDVGIEDASPESIRKALSCLRVQYQEDSEEFSMGDILRRVLQAGRILLKKEPESVRSLASAMGMGNSF